MHCKALGVKNVIAKVKDEVTQQVLEKVGADLVILPEVEAGISLAKTILFNHSIEVFQLDDDVVVAEFEPVSYTHLDVYKRQLVVRILSLRAVGLS